MQGALARQCFQVLDRLLSAVRDCLWCFFLLACFLCFLVCFFAARCVLALLEVEAACVEAVPKQLRVKAVTMIQRVFFM